MPIDRKDYEFTKQAARSAYENAIRDAEAIGGDGIPLPDVDQHLHPDYALVDHGHEQFDHEHPEYAEGEHTHPDYQMQIDHNEDRINALEHELEALAEVRESGEWELVSILDFDIRGSGQMTLADDDFTKNTNEITLHATDTEGLVHNFDKVVEGDNLEIVEEHTTRAVGDYGLYEVTEVQGMTFKLKLVRGMGTATMNSHFIVKFFHLNDNLDIAELDARYAMKTHSHSNYIVKESDNSSYKDWLLKANGTKKNPDDFAPKHSHPYASSSHSHNYAGTGHTHDYATSNHTHSVIFRSGTSTNPSLSKGEPFLNTSYKVVYVGF